MKSSWLLKPLILTAALATLTGCPALSGMSGVSGVSSALGEQAKARKTVTITGIPSEYEGSLIQVIASDSTDASGESLCMSGGIEGRNVKNGTGKSTLLKMNAASSVSAAAVLMGAAQSCDSKERIVVISFMSSDKAAGTGDENATLEGALQDTFLYTKGINICNDANETTKFTYSFKEMETKLQFSDFLRASDCEMLTDMVKGMQ